MEQCCGHIVKAANNSNYARRQKSSRLPICEPSMAICSEDDMANKNHLLLDSINSEFGRLWGLGTLLIALKCLKNNQCLSRLEMPNLLLFPDVQCRCCQRLFSRESICWRKVQQCVQIFTFVSRRWHLEVIQHNVYIRDMMNNLFALDSLLWWQ